MDEVQIIRISGAVLTVTITDPFDAKRRFEAIDDHDEEICHDFPAETAAALRKEQKLATRHAKTESRLVRRSSQRYGGYGHRTEKLHKIGRRTIVQ